MGILHRCTTRGAETVWLLMISGMILLPSHCVFCMQYLTVSPMYSKSTLHVPLCVLYSVFKYHQLYHMPMLLFIFDIHILIYSIHIISILYPYCINIISILYPYHILYLSSTSILPKRQGLSARILQRLGPAGDQRPRPGGMASSGFGTNSVARCSMHCIWGFP